MITRIEVTNYRCFRELDLDLGRFGVVVGPNGAGKATLLDIPVLLGDLVDADNVSTAFLEATQPRGPRASSLTELIHKGGGDSFVFAIEARLPDRVVEELVAGLSGVARRDESRWPRHLRYELRLRVPNGRALQVQREHLFTYPDQSPPPRGAARLHGASDLRREWQLVIAREGGGETELRSETRPRAKAIRTALDPYLLALPKVRFESRAEFPAARWLVDALTEGAVLFDPRWTELRKASPPGLPARVTPDGATLPWLAMALREEAPDHFAAWAEHVAIALPQVTAIEVVEREEDHHAYFRLSYAGGHVVTSSGLSDGTLRVLALTLLTYLPAPPRLLLVETPENGIHPQAIETVLEALSSMHDSQVLLSSHSPVVVANVPVGQLFAARLEADGAATVIPGARHPRLVDWKGALDLGTLFAAGVLG